MRHTFAARAHVVIITPAYVIFTQIVTSAAILTFLRRGADLIHCKGNSIDENIVH